MIASPIQHPIFANEYVTSWVKRVRANGGATPSTTTQAALVDFYNGLTTYGLLSKMIAVNCYVPDNFTASITPFIKAVGNDPWTTHNFAGTDLTINGLQGAANDGTQKYLDTGILGTNLPSDNNAGFTLYEYTASGDNPAGGVYEMGYTNDAGNPAALLTGHRSNTTLFFGLFYSTADGSVTGSPVSGGYISVNRVSSTDCRLYFANSTNAHAQIGSTETATNTGTRAADNIWVHCSNHYNAGTVFGCSSARLSFAAIHSGLASTDSSNFFNLIQIMRQNFGGGYV